jgi:hypothetical protein
MRFNYSTNSSIQNEFDSLPRIPLILQKDDQSIETNGLVDSGATVNVLPYELGVQLGGVWDNRYPVINLHIERRTVKCKQNIENRLPKEQL